jgi:hypothetical protein
VGQQQGLAPHAGGGKRSLGTGMAATDYNNIIFIRDLHKFCEASSGANDTGNAGVTKQSCRFT